jgi:hypothetical protein
VGLLPLAMDKLRASNGSEKLRTTERRVTTKGRASRLY